MGESEVVTRRNQRHVRLKGLDMVVRIPVERKIAKRREHDNGASRVESESIRFMCTGFHDYDRDIVEEILQEMGATLTEEVQECTHLICKRFTRSSNMLLGLSLPNVKYIVGLEWVDVCRRKAEFVDPAGYLLRDPEKEGVIGFKIETSLKSASRGKVFRNLKFLIARPHTDSADVDSWQKLIEANNGTVFLVDTYAQWQQHLDQPKPNEIFVIEGPRALDMTTRMLIKQYGIKVNYLVRI
ncbi:hypothetical protein SeMB42_g03657 [Synchytrium endobioticum]|uniref:BRCT domain-containing protein n=1 Tax=Synchytrium endobioticum TaxID=286115 RepID=A0A507D5I2_9FUNG|nr:hypothetical protein SeMB42_g03657 [Synchytrium endobioticum]TPX50340.1 hypothetical protein SeLEV6574_g00937 [Synchytrium endobioticum]